MVKFEKEKGLGALPTEATIPTSDESKELTTAGGQIADRATICAS
jgi:hypothetical protein